MEFGKGTPKPTGNLRRDKERSAKRQTISTNWKGHGMPIELDQPVDEVMRGRRATIRVFLDFKMKCVGCPIGAFHSVRDACIEHGIDLQEFLSALRRLDRDERDDPC